MLKIYSTLTRTTEPFKPLEENKVKMYVCGPTVYNFLHIGNARPLVVFDTIRRYLEFKGFDVTYVQNFTDIEDRIIKKAAEEGITAAQVSKKYQDEAIRDMDGLNVKKPSIAPLATEEVDTMLEMIGKLVEDGHAYESNGSVYFLTSSFKEYGKLSGKNTDELMEGARVDKDELKKEACDFVLWKAAKPGEPFWSSPWGNGRPGWHIECSAMSRKYLGETIDIHAGGEDLIFPHHENEIAQSEACNKKPFANYWLHNAMVNIDNKKMSKSLGNFLTIREIVEEFSYEVLRFFILQAHYRSPVNFSHDLLTAAQTSLGRILACLNNLQFLSKNANDSSSELAGEISEKSEQFRQRFEQRMDDDFNTADAISIIFEFVRYANTVAEKCSKDELNKLYTDISVLCECLGIRTRAKQGALSDDEVNALVEKRDAAKKAKDYKTADAIRSELAEQGIVLEDTPMGTRFVRK